MKLKRDALKFKYDRYALPAFDFFHFFSANASESIIFLRICVSYGASQRLTMKKLFIIPNYSRWCRVMSP